MPAGNYLGQIIAGRPYRWITVPIGMIIGYFIVKAEPAVYVLMEQEVVPVILLVAFGDNDIIEL